MAALSRLQRFTWTAKPRYGLVPLIRASIAFTIMKSVILTARRVCRVTLSIHLPRTVKAIYGWPRLKVWIASAIRRSSVSLRVKECAAVYLRRFWLPVTVASGLAARKPSIGSATERCLAFAQEKAYLEIK